MSMAIPENEQSGHVQTEPAASGDEHDHPEATLCPSCKKASLRRMRVAECPSCGFRKVEPEA